MPGTPHDSLFKSTFSQVEHAAGELRLVLPPRIAARLDFATLELCPGSFVDEELGQRHADLLFSVSLAGRWALLYVLFEHQSTFDALMPFRLLRYMVRIWGAHLAKHPDAKRLPVILPVVLHHSATGWTADASFESLLDVDAETLAEVSDYAPRFRFVLDDLSAQSDESIRGRAMTALGRLSLWCLRSSRAPEELVRSLGFWLDVMREVRRAPNGAAALRVIWRYVFAVNERLKPDELLKLLVRVVGEEGKEEVVTVAEQLREEGRAEGRAQGRAEGHVEGRREGSYEGRMTTLLRLLRARFGALPEAIVSRVSAADQEELDRWLDRVLTSPSLVHVLGD